MVDCLALRVYPFQLRSPLGPDSSAPVSQNPNIVVKLPADSVELPGNDLLFYVVPLSPTYKVGLTEQSPVNSPRVQIKCKRRAVP
jgi:hypothetical protein